MALLTRASVRCFYMRPDRFRRHGGQMVPRDHLVGHKLSGPAFSPFWWLRASHRHEVGFLAAIKLLVAWPGAFFALERGP